MPDNDDALERVGAVGDVTPLPASPPAKTNTTEQGSPADADVLATLANLLLGGTTEGGDLLIERLKRWQASADSQGNRIYFESPDETDNERLRYALIGLLYKAPGVAQGTLSTAVQVTDSAYLFVSNLLSPVTGSRFMRPVQRRYDNLAARGETIVERWIDTGRAAEQRSRALAREAAFASEDEIFDHTIAVMADKPEVRDLITAQSFGMASTLIGIVRERAATSDTRWERRVRRLFRRR